MDAFLEGVKLYAPYILGVLLAISELLALIPGIKANSVFTAIVGGVKWVKEKFFPAPKAE